MWIGCVVHFLTLDHAPLEIAYWVAQIFLAVIAAFSAKFAYDEFGFHERLEILRALQDPETRKARGFVLGKANGKAYEGWTDEDKFAASTVCASFDSAGFLMETRNKRLTFRDRRLVKKWAPTIIRTHEILVPFLVERRQQNGIDLWNSYDWLYRHALNYPIRRSPDHTAVV